MIDFKLTKQATKSLKKIAKSDRAVAIRVKKAILNIAEESLKGEALQGFSQFKKVRIGKYRLIYTQSDNILLITLIEKRETIYKTFGHLFKSSDFL